MACAYLLTLDVAPSAPSLERSRTAKEKVKAHAEQVMNAKDLDEYEKRLLGAIIDPGAHDARSLTQTQAADYGAS